MAYRHNFRNLKIWQTGMDIIDMVYDFIPTLPDAERYNLMDQMRRSGNSIPSNIAEGSGKISAKDFARYVGISLSSAYELETHFLIAQRRKLGDQSQIEPVIDLLHREQRMLTAFQNQLLNAS